MRSGLTDAELDEYLRLEHIVRKTKIRAYEKLETIKPGDAWLIRGLAMDGGRCFIILFYAAVAAGCGALITRAIYDSKERDPEEGVILGALVGFIGGFIFLIPLWILLVIFLSKSPQSLPDYLGYYTSSPMPGSRSHSKKLGAFAPVSDAPTSTNAPRAPAVPAGPSIESIYQQGVWAYRRKDHDAAIRYFSEAVGRGADQVPPLLYYYRAESYRALGENEKADQDLEIYNRLSKNT